MLAIVGPLDCNPLPIIWRLYPNPASGEELWIQSTQSIEEVAVYNLRDNQWTPAMRPAIAAIPMAGLRLVCTGRIFENGARSTQRVIRK